MNPGVEKAIGGFCPLEHSAKWNWDHFLGISLGEALLLVVTVNSLDQYETFCSMCSPVAGGVFPFLPF